MCSMPAAAILWVTSSAARWQAATPFTAILSLCSTYRSMEEAVLAYVDYKYAQGRGTFRDGGAHTAWRDGAAVQAEIPRDRKSTRLNSSHVRNSYAVFCLKKKT